MIRQNTLARLERATPRELATPSVTLLANGWCRVELEQELVDRLWAFKAARCTPLSTMDDVVNGLLDLYEAKGVH
jgi:hypothetical protein